MYDAIPAGTTSYLMTVTILQDGSGANPGNGKTGLAAASVTTTYSRQGDSAAPTSVTLDGTMTQGTWKTRGWVEIGNGDYQFGVPDAALVAGVNGVRFKFRCTGGIDTTLRVLLLGANDLRSTLLVNATSANVTKWASGDVPTPSVTGVPKVDAAYMLGGAIVAQSIIPVDVQKFLGKTPPTPLVDGVPIVDMGYIGGKGADGPSSGRTAFPNTVASPSTGATVVRANTVGTGSTTTTVVLDAGASATDNDHAYIGRMLLLTSGTLINQSAFITGYVGATKTATVTPALGGSATAGDTYSLQISDSNIQSVQGQPATVSSDPVDSNIVSVNGDDFTGSYVPATTDAASAQAFRAEMDASSTQFAAIKAKTDNLPGSPAAVGSPMTLAAASSPAQGITVVGSTASVVTLSGLPSGRNYTGQSLYHQLSGESRLIASQTTGGGNYTLTLGTLTDTEGPFSVAPSTGDVIIIGQ